ncbi:DUF5655 domain-containing protein [Amycolatopsis speibonae]|uniref:DUF5655 domain-containing protein n=1 Tax=Amycolatopsis speibonae TaxID=1450224 RepID=A0ABV7NP51_9PSEU
MTDEGDRRVLGWQPMMEKAARLLAERTGEDKAAWNGKVTRSGAATEGELRSWLSKNGVTGYAQDLLVYERYGYPDFMLTDPLELIDAQYADRPDLRPVCDAVIDEALATGEVIVQARKTFVSLVAPRRTFGIIKPTTKTRVDLGLKLPGEKPGGRLLSAKSLSQGNVRVALHSVDDVDDELRTLLERGYEANS